MGSRKMVAKKIAKKSIIKKTSLKKTVAKKNTTKPTKKSKPKAAQKPKSPIRQRANYRLNEFIIYPSHGVGQIIEISEQNIAEYTSEFFVIKFKQERMVLKVPVGNIASVGMRKLSENKTINSAINVLKQPAKIKRTMWSRRAQEYEQKITSGDLKLLCEVVRDLHRNEDQPEQSYSERQLYEGAFIRLVDEVAAAQKTNDEEAIEKLQSVLNHPNRFSQLA